MRLNTSFFSLILPFLLLTCEKPSPKILPSEPNKMEVTKIQSMVVYSNGEGSRINHADLTVEKASIGAFFKDGDMLLTGQGAIVDVQINDEALLRFKNAEVQFLEIGRESEPGKVFTRILLKKGKLIGKINKKLLSPEYFIYTPHTVSKIDGTEFFIEVEDTLSSIRVMSGKISTNYFIQAIENKFILLGSELGGKWESRKKQIDSSQMAEVHLLSPKQSKETLKNEEIEDLQKLLTKNPIQITEFQIKKMEEQELKTLVLEDSRVTKRMIEINEELTSGKVTDEKITKLEIERGELENQLKKKQHEEKRKFNESIVVAPKKLKNKKEIVKYYERMEKIILTRGRIEVGAIISQEGEEIIIHTEYGIKRIPNEEVVEVIYEYQRKAKL